MLKTRFPFVSFVVKNFGFSLNVTYVTLSS